MENINASTEQLVNFLKTLSHDIESNKLSPTRLQSVGDFYMEYQFQEQVDKDNQDSSDHNDSECSPEEVIRFIILGWYIYRLILRKERLPTSNFSHPA